VDGAGERAEELHAGEQAERLKHGSHDGRALIPERRVGSPPKCRMCCTSIRRSEMSALPD
jgi:hypothetical protein